MFCSGPGASLSAANEAGDQRTQYRAGVAVAITGAVTVTPSPVPGLVQISWAFSTRLLSPTGKSQDSPQGTTGKKRAAPEAPSAACRHADLELCVLGPACSSWTAVKFLARVPRAPDDRKMLKIQDLVSIVNQLV